MTRKRKRLLVVLLGLGMLGIASALVLFAFNDNLVFFMSPSDLATKGAPETRRLRLGGLVEAGSVAREADGRTIDFRVTDGNSAVPVIFSGVLPDLFREGQGVVVEGALGKNGVFKADTVLAKHDERYMPPEVAEALKKSGHWQGEHPPAATAAKP
ncbi:MAG TPA: cytochrome c maturation protein CcmE [Stellaceae bacterium]|jgi:cytochrome c-type biogenesis protein CcmE|nr:cytochrome c maturation protein CcmE [Stellaceae bacterium]